MDLLWQVVQLLVVILVLAVIVGGLWAYSSIQTFMRYFPDRPVPFPAITQAEINNALDEKGPGVFVEFVKKYGRTFGVGTGVATADPFVVKRVLMDRAHAPLRPASYRLFANMLPYSDGILFKMNSAWLQRRHALIPMFAPRFLDAFARVAHESAVESAEIVLAGRTRRGYVADRFTCGELTLGGEKRCDESILYLMRAAALRFLARWGFGLSVESYHVGVLPSLQTSSTTASPSPSPSPSSSPSTSPIPPALDGEEERPRFTVLPRQIASHRRLLRSLDQYSHILFDRLQACTSLPPALYLYGALWQEAWGFEREVKEIIDTRGYESGSCGVYVDRDGELVDGSAPLLPNAISILLGQDFRLSELASELNHIQGAHKAAALVSSFLLWELSQPSNSRWRKAVLGELDSVLGKREVASPAAHPGVFSDIFARSRGDEAEVRRTQSPVPTLRDLEDMPVTRRVIWEVLRHHVVSFAVARRLGAEIPVPDPHTDSPSSSSPSHPVADLVEGQEVQVWLHALHFSPELWGPTVNDFDPDRFLPLRGEDDGGREAVARFRSSGCYFPFLESQRRCAGEHVAWLQLLVNLNVFLRIYGLRTKGPLSKTKDMFVAIRHKVPYVFEAFEAFKEDE